VVRCPADLLGALELSIEGEGVELSVPRRGRAGDGPHRIPLPDDIDPERTDVIYSGGTLVVRLPRRIRRPRPGLLH
jgi:HSP20 family molecular chaperone IbpA